MSDTKEEEKGEVVIEEQHQQQQQETKTSSTEPEITKKFEKMNISLSIWPPTPRTREAVINRLIETLAAPSILSKRYGSLPSEEASIAAKSIEEEAFAIASKTVSTTSVEEESSISSNHKEDDGIEILQIYSKEISKRMLEVVKAKAAAAVATSSPVVVESNDSVRSTTAAAAASETSEEISSIEPESS